VVAVAEAVAEPLTAQVLRVPVETVDQV